MTQPQQSLADFLRSLGNTPDEVADSLRKMGVRGDPECASACPIAKALLMSGWETVSVGILFASAGSETVAYVGEAPAVANFIWNFDDRDYPDLIAPDLIAE